LAFYAHLRTVSVKSGDNVKIGQNLGEEGKTGRAGHRHLHFSVHENTLGIKPDDLQKSGVWLPPSIPFETHILDQSAKTFRVSVMDLPCIDSNELSRTPFYGAL
jgi:murein DD-endopeptidase MepM/ murein hydrolase activator NlpD